MSVDQVAGPAVAGSVLLGGLITWWCSRAAYRAAARELLAETARLRRLADRLEMVLAQAGAIQVRRDGDGLVLIFEPPPRG